jgi:hypothetical protein
VDFAILHSKVFVRDRACDNHFGKSNHTIESLSAFSFPVPVVLPVVSMAGVTDELMTH